MISQKSFMVLDVTAGTRIMWRLPDHNPYSYDTYYPDVFVDKNRNVKPDIVAVWKHLPFKDKSFDIVFFDPPHHQIGSGLMSKRYGSISRREFIKEMIRVPEEFHRILNDGGKVFAKICDRNSMMDILKRNMWRCFKLLRFFRSENKGKANPNKLRKKYRTYWMEYEKQKEE
jgi:predicted methyltransferase